MNQQIQTAIEQKLKDVFSPVEFMTVDNESDQHISRQGNETHFKVVVVSDIFAGKLPVKRHQYVYKVLHEEMKKIHALALHVYTVEEWLKKKNNHHTSPKCAH